MEVITIEQAPRPVRDLYNKGFAAFERGNLDYAVDLFSSCVKAAPGLLAARKYLRAAEVRRAKSKKQVSELFHAISLVSGLPVYLAAMGKAKSKPEQAMVAAEKLLRRDPLNLNFIKLFSEAASNADFPDAAIQTLEIAREHYPENVLVLNWLGSLFLRVGRTRAARQCFEKLFEIKPNDPAVMKALKDATAIDSMSSDGWEAAAEKGGSFHSMLRDQKQAELLERDQKAVKSDKDLDALVESTRAKMEAEPGNINYYRQLARLYAQQQDFAQALATLEDARRLAPGDPELDQAISGTRVQDFDFQIAQLRKAGDEAAAAAKEHERDQFVFDDMQDRVARYPNDLGLKFELGAMLFDNQYVDESIGLFQLAQRSPKHRIQSLIYLARCFRAKQQYDLAAEHYERAMADMIGVDDSKKSALYELGEVYELMQDPEAAARCYKQVYQVDIAYRDIAAKIEQVYKKKA